MQTSEVYIARRQCIVYSLAALVGASCHMMWAVMTLAAAAARWERADKSLTELATADEVHEEVDRTLCSGEIFQIKIKM